MRNGERRGFVIMAAAIIHGARISSHRGGDKLEAETLEDAEQLVQRVCDRYPDGRDDDRDEDLTHAQLAAKEILAAFGGVMLGFMLRRTFGRSADRATAGWPMRQQSVSTSSGPVLMTGVNSAVSNS